MSPQPYSIEKRSQITRKLKKEARRAAERVGADSCIIIAFFKDGQHVHLIEGGESPIARGQLYASMQTSHQVLKESGGKDVALS